MQTMRLLCPTRLGLDLQIAGDVLGEDHKTFCIGKIAVVLGF